MDNPFAVFVPQSNVSLLEYNTFHVDAKAEWFASIDFEYQIPTMLDWVDEHDVDLHLIGGGSNILLTKDVSGLVVRIAIDGLECDVETFSDKVLLTAGAGIQWERVVECATSHGWWGIENLTLIPGVMGSAPVQNIGAYGVELADLFYSLRAWDRMRGEVVTLVKEDCRFGYRQSVFKEWPNRYIILSVSLLLKKEGSPRIGYGQIETKLKESGIDSPSPADIMNVIRSIREEKLPDTKRVGCAGSFFKNPVVSADFFNSLKRRFPEMPSYIIDENFIKIPAGWLIEQSGWKGFRKDNIGVWPHQALVIVNYGNATGKELLSLAHDIIDSVRTKFDVVLYPEVNIL